MRIEREDLAKDQFRAAEGREPLVNHSHAHAGTQVFYRRTTAGAGDVARQQRSCCLRSVDFHIGRHMETGSNDAQYAPFRPKTLGTVRRRISKSVRMDWSRMYSISNSTRLPYSWISLRPLTCQ